LHCTSEYPTSIDDVNLCAMATIKSAFGIRVGYSDHTTGTAVAQAAVALGACVIEKHLTLDRTMSGPDHAASCEPAEFADLVRGIRDVARALGSGVKAPTYAEIANRRTMRKGLYAARNVSAGTVISEADLAVVRPQSIEGPEVYYEWLGRVAPRAFSAGDEITWT
jgi:N,N'-diacetyllegionaminate synthase